MTEAGTINNSVAKEVFEKVFDEDIDPERYVEEHGLKSDNDEDALRATIEQIVKAIRSLWRITTTEKRKQLDFWSDRR